MARTRRIGMTKLDNDGHFPGCSTAGCAATRCADARFQVKYAKYLDDRDEAEKIRLSKPYLS